MNLQTIFLILVFFFATLLIMGLVMAAWGFVKRPFVRERFIRGIIIYVISFILGALFLILYLVEKFSSP